MINYTFKNRIYEIKKLQLSVSNIFKIKISNCLNTNNSFSIFNNPVMKMLSNKLH